MKLHDSEVTNKGIVLKALDILHPELEIFVERSLRNAYGENWKGHVRQGKGDPDVPRLCGTIVSEWNTLFCDLLDEDVKSLCHDVRRARNCAAHRTALNLNRTLTSLIYVEELLAAIGSKQASLIRDSKMEFLRRVVEKRADFSDYAITTATLIWCNVEYPLKEGKNTFGRDHGNDVELKDPCVSRRHGAIEIQKDQIYVYDYGSSNGTRINGKVISEYDRTAISENDLIQINTVKFQIRRLRT